MVCKHLLAALDGAVDPSVAPKDSKKRARLNCISHLLSLIPYKSIERETVVLEDRPPQRGYVRPPMSDQTFVPEIHGKLT